MRPPLKQTQPKLQIIMLTAYEDTENIFNALPPEPLGYLLKRAPRAELLAALTKCSGAVRR